MIDDLFPEAAPGRPIWLITLADLALLLVGFFVLVQATQNLDRKALAKGLRDGFGAAAMEGRAPAVAAMPVGASSVAGFAAGASSLPARPDALVAWARDALRDKRVTLTITGSVDGSSGDVDPVTGSATLLAIDRARAVAAALATARGVPGNRMAITSGTDPVRRGHRDVTVTLAFSGARQ
ncbi:MAG: flagellar motor protein MotB [Sphingomonas sp.]